MRVSRRKVYLNFVDLVVKLYDPQGALTFGSYPRQLRITMESDFTTGQDWIQLQAEEESVDAQHRHRDRGLLAIGLFKLGKAILFFALGVGAIHLLHKDLGDEIVRLAKELKFDPESKIVALVLDKVDLIDDHRLKLISFGTFAYSALALTEGIGLVLEKVWAEYLTLILTMSFLPWELYELAAHSNWYRLSLLLINLAVLWYLVWLLRKKKTAESEQVLENARQ